MNGKSKKEKLSLWDSRRQDRFIDEELDYVAGRLVFYINLAVPSPDTPRHKTEDNEVRIHAAGKVIRRTNRLHNLAVGQRSHIQHLQLMLADNKINIEKETAYFHNVTLYMPMPAKAHSNRITNDFALEIDRITDILHDNTGYKWIDNTE